MKLHTIALYTLTGLLLVLSACLKAPSVCIASVVLFCTLSGIEVAEKILTKASRDGEITALIARMDKLEKDHKGLSADIINVAERAKTVLGEVY